MAQVISRRKMARFHYQGHDGTMLYGSINVDGFVWPDTRTGTRGSLGSCERTPDGRYTVRVLAREFGPDPPHTHRAFTRRSDAARWLCKQYEVTRSANRPMPQQKGCEMEPSQAEPEPSETTGRNPQHCPHKQFETATHVHGLTEVEGGPPVAWLVEVRVRCAQCAEDFIFRCPDVGLLWDRPTVDVAGTCLNVPIVPRGNPEAATLTLGYVIRQKVNHHA